MSDTFYKPLTQELRSRINSSVDRNIYELNTCKPNVYVNAQLIGYQAFRNVINALPDGYPLPMKRR